MSSPSLETSAWPIPPSNFLDSDSVAVQSSDSPLVHCMSPSFFLGDYGILNSRATDTQVANTEQHDGESLCRVAASHKTTKEAAAVGSDATPRNPTGAEMAESCESPIRGTDARSATTDQSPRAAGPQPLNSPSHHKANEQAFSMDECQESSAKRRALEPVVAADLVPAGVVAADPPARPGILATWPVDLTIDNDWIAGSRRRWIPARRRKRWATPRRGKSRRTSINLRATAIRVKADADI
jgi:hypothetical protein